LMKAVIGKAYRTRFGWVALRERNVAEVERTLLEIPAAVAVARAGTGAIMMAQGELVDALRAWRDEAARLCMEKVTRGVARAGSICVNSCYRPLGTTAGAGKYEDPCGCVDSTDDYGHWSGFAVDVPTKFFRLSCVPALTVEEINLAAARAGLERPFLSGRYGGEWWHYRVRG
jgi:D-alanyl-D-alanine dipeptidase